MTSDSCRTTTTTTTTTAKPEPEHLPCPRCDSTNTKFCYYNNYNSSQPRHFCKACRRYWTHGGTLRDIPIGGATRKNTKRSRITTRTTHTTNSTLEFPPIVSPMLFPFAGDHAGGFHLSGDGKPESFTSLLNGAQWPGFFGGFEDGSFGFGRGIWPFSGVGDGAYYAAGGGGGGGEGGLSWPDLAI